MIKKTVKYGLLGLMLMGTTACHKRTIILEPQAQRTVERPVVKVPVKRPTPIKEEILLGRNSKNPSLGNRVDVPVPVNNPTLGEIVGGSSEENRTVVLNKTDSEGYDTMMVDNIETIVFPHSTYVMSEDEVAEYELNQMQKNLTTPALNSDLPLSDFLCEDNLKPIKVAGIANTYECS